MSRLVQVKRHRFASWNLVALLVISAIAIAFFATAVDRTRRFTESKQVELLESRLRRAVVTCYAVEGRYPENVEYLIDEYGIYVDASKYAVHYDAFSTNVLPDVFVVAKED